MVFLGTSIWHASPTGLILSGFVYFVYMFAALGFEEDFTNKIYVSEMANLRQIWKRRSDLYGTPLD